MPKHQLHPETRRELEAMLRRPITDEEAAEVQTVIMKIAKSWADEIDREIAEKVYADLYKA